MILWILLHVLINDLTCWKIKYAISNWYATCIQTALDSIVCFCAHLPKVKKWDNKEQWSKFWQQQQQHAHQLLLIMWLVMKHWKITTIKYDGRNWRLDLERWIPIIATRFTGCLVLSGHNESVSKHNVN